MSRTVEYHCLDCLDHTVAREFDVSHLSLTCEACGEFGRFVHGGVLKQFERFESSPPTDIEWDLLDRMEKLLIAERLVRTERTLDDIEIDQRDEERTA